MEMEERQKDKAVAARAKAKAYRGREKRCSFRKARGSTESEGLLCPDCTAFAKGWSTLVGSSKTQIMSPFLPVLLLELQEPGVVT